MSYLCGYLLRGRDYVCSADTTNIEEWRDVAVLQLPSHHRADLVPPLHGIGLCIVVVQRAVAHLDTLRIDLDSCLDVLERVMPAVSQVSSVRLGTPCSCETQLLVGARLSVSVYGFRVESRPGTHCQGDIALASELQADSEHSGTFCRLAGALRTRGKMRMAAVT